ncbi:exocyst complex component EXO84B-like isoform X2 [Salvia miltiorrhiza]|uniref:exocyst complex component EXO84B-like isoform X2 n=1 Tax=Salvia miltiorrhiza TaxID=226208 RepID=UPI0025AB9D30|nr:exocyst complex component EXO84B-like isoform X2 [Salvia miltiorrhiza]
MDSTSTPRFRFRDHRQDIADDSSSEGHTTADSSSLPSDGDDEPQLQSMTAKGVRHLCSELLELKQESDEDFQKSIFSNYSAFLVIMKDIEVLQTELLGLKYQASLQKRLVKDVSDKIYSTLVSEETIGSMLQETLPVETSSPSLLDVHAENVSDILDSLISEQRLDDALALLEMEGEYVLYLRPDEYSPDQMMSYKSIISGKRAILTDRLMLVAKHPRVSAAELQKALLGLCQLGENHLANQLVLQYYHSRIASGICNLQSSKGFPNVLYIQQVAKCVCSMISQAVRSYLALNGGTYPYSSELTRWAAEETGVFAACFIKYIESISDISGRLSTAVAALQIVMSYCSLLETQRIHVQHSLMELVRPCIEGVLQLHINHLSRVMIMVTSTETWVLDRYYVSGILTGRNTAIIDQQPECFFLTNSGRKFVTLFQSVAEEISPLITFQMEGSVLKGIIDFFTAYVVILESAITADTDAMEKEGFKIKLPETPTQGVFILANLSTLVQFSSSIIRNLFDGIHHLDFEMDSYATLVQDIYSRLRSCFLDHFISNIFSPNAGHESSPEIRLSRQNSCRYFDLTPSVPYLELYLELKKLEKLADDDCIDTRWLMSLFLEMMDATFEWISTKSEIWAITENFVANRTKFMQFLVETARRSEYLSDKAITISDDIIRCIETSFLSAGLSPLTLRDSSGDEWPANVARAALHKLQRLLENEDAADEEGSSHHRDELESVIEKAIHTTQDTQI